MSQPQQQQQQQQFFIGVMKKAGHGPFSAIMALDSAPHPGEYSQVLGPFDSELDQITAITNILEAPRHVHNHQL